MLCLWKFISSSTVENLLMRHSFVKVVLTSCLSPKHPDVLGFASSKAAEPVVGAAESGPEEVKCPRHVQTPGPHMETSFQGDFSGCTFSASKNTTFDFDASLKLVAPPKSTPDICCVLNWALLSALLNAVHLVCRAVMSPQAVFCHISNCCLHFFNHHIFHIVNQELLWLSHK